ncbi:hypothetical protein Clacol_007943 [Clathrus columnatus]|uniref:Uncharacterized protein n=1 Tax=Clathrus columnatus TaxID=1419009 RepID=A0AAV5AIV2_9AGAM|nr:hypothetical protein Clacol_007943 [Clathrus columnatus]
MPPSLPPDQSLYINTLGERLVILSVSEEGIRIGEKTNYPDFTKAGFKHGVYLYTENLAITSDISGTQGLTIATRSLQCPHGIGIVLNVNGERGKDSAKSEPEDKTTVGEVERNGKTGGNGGVLSVFVEDLSKAAAEALELQARGGDGGDTYLTGGRVGNGGKGGTIYSVFQPTYVQLLPVLNRYFTQEEFHPEGTEDERKAKYDEPVTKSHFLYEGAKETISLGRILLATQEIEEIFQPLVNEISKIDQGDVRTILQVKIGLNNSRHNLNRLIDNQECLMAPAHGSVRRGYGGRGVGLIGVEPGKPGDDGHETQVFLRVPRNFTSVPIPIAHPLQCFMLLERANVFFYINSPSLRIHAKLLYQRILDRLSFLPLKPEDPLYKAYEDSPIMPSTSLAELEGIKTKASNLLVQLTSGELNYHGLQASWVPRASYKFYSGHLDRAMEDLTIFEKAYIEYNEALKAQEDLNDKLKIAYNNTANMISSLQADQHDLMLLIQDIYRDIIAATPVVENARKKLIQAYEAELKVIKSSFGLSVPQLINALTMIAFSPKSLMSGIQSADLIYQGFTTVPSIDGTSISKEYLAKEFLQSEGTIKNISTLLKTKIDGTYQLDDPFATRLIVEKERIFSQLDQFSQEAFGGVNDGETRKQLEEKFDALIKAMTKRNGSILEYNVTLRLLISKGEEEEAFKKKEIELIHRQVKHEDPDLPVVTSYVRAIYQASRTRVMKLIGMTLRSLDFRMVNTSDVYDYAFNGDPENPTEVDKVPLSLTSFVLRNIRSNIEDKFTQQIERWGSEPAKFPRNFDKDEGKRFRLSRSQLNLLVNGEDHTVVVKIPIVDQDSKNAGDFEGCCNIRIYRVRFALTGLKTSTSLPAGRDALVVFKLTHGGNETILDRSNAAFEFRHEPVSTIFSFRLDGGGYKSVLDNGNIGQSDINEVATSYAAPGPFSEWTVNMKGTDWKHLDVGKVTDGYFDFCGTNYTFS